MGRSYTPTYRVETFDNRMNVSLYQRRLESCAWNCKRDGRPTEANAEKYRQEMNKTFLPGGVNYHISESCGFTIHISTVWIIRQSTGELVAKAKAPMFEVM